jgi:WXG100 family type VII secretion target
MPGFTVEPQALLASVDQMSQFERQLEQSLARVNASVQSLGLSWHGEAATAQQAAQQQWDSGAEELRGALAQLRDMPSKHTPTTPTRRR